MVVGRWRPDCSRFSQTTKPEEPRTNFSAGSVAYGWLERQAHLDVEPEPTIVHLLCVTVYWAASYRRPQKFGADTGFWRLRTGCGGQSPERSRPAAGSVQSYDQPTKEQSPQLQRRRSLSVTTHTDVTVSMRTRGPWRLLMLVALEKSNRRRSRRLAFACDGVTRQISGATVPFSY